MKRLVPPVVISTSKALNFTKRIKISESESSLPFPDKIRLNGRDDSQNTITIVNILRLLDHEKVLFYIVDLDVREFKDPAILSVLQKYENLRRQKDLYRKWGIVEGQETPDSYTYYCYMTDNQQAEATPQILNCLLKRSLEDVLKVFEAIRTAEELDIDLLSDARLGFE
jgi:hypothetical protein